jgi:hypothetical protein
MQGGVDFTASLGKFPLSEILFCVLVMFRWADCELDCEKPDHRSSGQYDEPTRWQHINLMDGPGRRFPGIQFGRPDFF